MRNSCGQFGGFGLSAGSLCLVALLTSAACGGEARDPHNTSSTAGSGSLPTGDNGGANSSAGAPATPAGGGRDTTASAGATGGIFMLPTVDPAKVPQCFQELAAGSCTQAIVRYYYDPTTKKCQQFSYTGCNGNDNNFATNAECVSFCFGERQCHCDDTNDKCKVVGACTECPIDPNIAEGDACDSAGLACSQPGGNCTCQADSGKDPTWHCRVKAR